MRTIDGTSNTEARRILFPMMVFVVCAASISVGIREERCSEIPEKSAFMKYNGENQS